MHKWPLEAPQWPQGSSAACVVVVVLVVHVVMETMLAFAL